MPGRGPSHSASPRLSSLPSVGGHFQFWIGALSGMGRSSSGVPCQEILSVSRLQPPRAPGQHDGRIAIWDLTEMPSPASEALSGRTDARLPSRSRQRTGFLHRKAEDCGIRSLLQMKEDAGERLGAASLRRRGAGELRWVRSTAIVEAAP